MTLTLRDCDVAIAAAEVYPANIEAVASACDLGFYDYLDQVDKDPSVIVDLLKAYRETLTQQPPG